jgi:hypothetical protein
MSFLFGNACFRQGSNDTAGCRSGSRSAVPPGRLDRAAFELAVADAAELLQAQLR